MMGTGTTSFKWRREIGFNFEYSRDNWELRGVIGVRECKIIKSFQD
jgi:hypothetical protein